MPLHYVLPQLPFEKWGLDYVGPIKPVAWGSQAWYIIVTTDYMTKLVEAQAIHKVDARKTTMFIYEKIITQFGCHLKIVTDTLHQRSNIWTPWKIHDYPYKEQPVLSSW